MAPPPNLRKYLFVVRATSRPVKKPIISNSKTAQTDEEKQRERQRSENEHKKLEQEAINYKRDKESREARLLDLEIRRANEKDRRLKQHQQYQIQHQQQSQQHSSLDSQQGTSSQYYQQQQQQQQQQHPQTHLTHYQLNQSEKSTPTSGVTYVSELKSPYDGSGDTTIYDRSIPRAFRSRSAEKEKEAVEKRRREIAEASGSKAIISTTPSPQTVTGPPPSRSVVAGPPATAAAATAAIIPILPLGVATLRDDSTESDQSLTYPPPALSQPDAYHRIV